VPEASSPEGFELGSIMGDSTWESADKAGNGVALWIPRGSYEL